MSGLYTGLLEEIKFWQSLMNESEFDENSAEYLRMKAALQLAQMKLDDLADEQSKLVCPDNTATWH